VSSVRTGAVAGRTPVKAGSIRERYFLGDIFRDQQFADGLVRALYDRLFI
jgi:hypothetical protein